MELGSIGKVILILIHEDIQTWKLEPGVLPLEFHLVWYLDLHVFFCRSTQTDISVTVLISFTPRGTQTKEIC